MLGALVGMIEGPGDAAGAIGVTNGSGALSWLGWRWPGHVGVALLLVGVCLFVPMIQLLTSEFLGEGLAAREKVGIVLLLAPPSVEGTLLVIGHQSAAKGESHSAGHLGSRPN